MLVLLTIPSNFLIQGGVGEGGGGGVILHMQSNFNILSITHDAHRVVHSLIGAWMNGGHRTCTEMAAASCGTSHAPTNSAVSTPFQWILKIWAIKQVTCSESHMT